MKSSCFIEDIFVVNIRIVFILYRKKTVMIMFAYESVEYKKNLCMKELSNAVSR